LGAHTVILKLGKPGLNDRIVLVINWRRMGWAGYSQIVSYISVTLKATKWSNTQMILLRPI
jgi:hypothetical protein